MFFQKTLRAKAKVTGIGLHSGEPCSLSFVPAPANTGVYFVRTDLAGRPSLKVDARWVTATGLATTLGGPDFSVSTVEHCLSALSALRIDNLVVELDGPEIPIMDGSAAPFLDAIQRVGVVELDQPRKYYVARDKFRLEDGDRWAEVTPYHGLRLTIVIDFQHSAIGRQELDLDINEQSFASEIARARTFGFVKDLDLLRSQGLARGANEENAIGLDDQRVINTHGLRWPDEFVRHKALDALGDLVTLCNPLLGHLRLYKAGHDMMNRFVRSLMDHASPVTLMELGAQLSTKDQWMQGIENKNQR